MNRKPKIAIIGRPNVGKSALFNRICKKRLAIVDEAEGITRDRLYSEGELFGRSFIAIDTGGINPRSNADFNALIIQQTEIAIEEADSLILVVDSNVGVTLLDEEVASLLHQSKKPLTLAINKVDSPDKENVIHDFYSLGIRSMVPVSAAQNWQIAELMLAALQPIPEYEEEIQKEDIGISVAIVGRPNVGKSSLLNTLLDEKRAMVSPIAGTTRDSIDVTIERDHLRYTLIDTAGIRKKAKESEAVDKFAAIRTERAIDRADICLLLIDAQQGITSQEKRIAKTIEDAGKGCILLFNKWDLVKGFRMEHCLKLVEDELPFLSYCPKLMISATSCRNIDKIFPLIQEVNTAYNTRITTHQLNVCIEKAMQKVHPPMIRGKRLRVYYLAQVDICPPRFVLFINHLELMSPPYEKYLYNQLRIAYPFTGTPLKIFLKKKKEKSL